MAGVGTYGVMHADVKLATPSQLQQNAVFCHSLSEPSRCKKISLSC